jgi:ABC-type branched-subunit amino acid transport system ATPase component
MVATIEIDGLRKRFGPVQALDGMTFTAGPGQVTGFVGPNGAGKPVTELRHSFRPGQMTNAISRARNMELAANSGRLERCYAARSNAS